MAKLAPPERILVRGVPDSYASCERVDRTVDIDVAAARRQHAAYVETIVGLGVPVEVLAADPACPDACFVEDTAVVLAQNALATRPGAASRRPEVSAVAAVLATTHRVHTMDAPATLDGGDVLRVGSRLFVGLSARTNREGADVLARVAALEDIEVVVLEVRGGLHLKSACSLARETSIVYDAAAIDDAALEAFRASGLGCLRAAEPAGANVLALGATVLVSAAAPRTAERLAQSGDVLLVDVAELHKGDGALTCLSLRFPAPGAWST